MRTYAGIWLDHEKATIALFTKNDRLSDSPEDDESAGPTLRVIESDVEGHIKLAGGSRTGGTPYGPQDVADEKKINRRRDLELKHYYREIIKELSGAWKIIILGPGEAKKELYKEIGHSKQLHAKSIDIEPADRMTENQLIAELKHRFAL